MNFLDSHPKSKYSSKQLCDTFKATMTSENVYRAMKQIIKRKEYCANVLIVNGHPTAIYGRVVEEN